MNGHKKVTVLLILFLATQLPALAQAGGKVSKKSGLLKATQVNGQAFNNVKAELEKQPTSRKDKKGNVIQNMTAAERLRYDLLTGYDATAAPEYNHKQNINIRVDLTFRQILDLDEKNQILKSLIWFRIFWDNRHFIWNPKDYDDISTLHLPVGSIWMPDIVVYEEIGTHSYSPRLSRVEISNDGSISYKEPVAFETTCSIDTAFFPFDMQTCHLTFVSWSQPLTHIDLTSQKTQEDLVMETKKYFVNTGEWKLSSVKIHKRIRNFGNLATNKLHDSNGSEELNGITTQTPRSTEAYFTFESLHVGRNIILDSPTISVPVSRFTTNSMYPEVVYTVKVRRNSSLYIQSMLLPSIILTAVALFGFYLPPESGERIGLQITILLTFMVFLLAVGEMFPASTGPYLGVYFVLCMTLLCLNLVMTITVLHMHFKPVVIKNHINRDRQKSKALQKLWRCVSGCRKSDEESSARQRKGSFEKRRKKAPGSTVPRNLRKVLQLIDYCWPLGEHGARWMRPVTDDELDISEDDPSFEDDQNLSGDDVSFRSRNDSVMIHKEVSRKKNDNMVAMPLFVSSLPLLGTPQKRQTSDDERDMRQSKPDTATDEDAADGSGETLSEKPLQYNNLAAEPSSNGSSNHQLTVGGADLKRDTKSQSSGRGNGQRSPSLTSRVLKAIGAKKSRNSKTKQEKREIRKRRTEALKQQKEEEQELQDLEQEEWKSVARAMDVICFRLYVLVTIISHIGLLGAIFSALASENC